MSAKVVLIYLGAVILVSFNDVKKERYPVDLKNGHIDFSINPSGNEFIMPSNAKAELQMIDKINALRKKKGLKALKYDPKLTLAARYHAADMAIEGYFEHHTYNFRNHQLVDDLGTFQRLKRFYKGPG
ncbi:MAG: CAP domain-containing protein, partial [Bacteroidetes bacterium]|nr:CAP domain-containing protein [Bacteroidota bacterium]